MSCALRCALRLLWVERTVTALDLGAKFYQEALGFAEANAEPASDALYGGHALESVWLRLGDQKLRLTAFTSPGTAYPLDSTSADLWFQHLALVTPSMETAYTRLRQYQEIPISEDGPQRLPPATGNVTAYKFCDPDHHPLELIHFPPGTGDVRWQQKAITPAIGIDHSALSISNAAQSIEFYCNTLGMKVVARQINCGAEQERLDNLAGDIVEVVALEFANTKTPHIELLAYQSPVGRKLSSPWQPQDVVADRLVLEVSDIPKILERLDKKRLLNEASNAALIQDPDGHLLVLKDRSPSATDVEPGWRG